jgi:hypothetical protein
VDVLADLADGVDALSGWVVEFPVEVALAAEGVRGHGANDAGRFGVFWGEDWF